MLLNKKCVYLGVTLFSAMILTTLPSQTVKADSTSSSTTTTSTADTSTPTSVSSSTTSAPVSTSVGTTTSTGTTAVTSTGSSTVAPTTSSSSATTPVTTSSSSTTAPVTTSSSSTTAPVTTSSSSTTAPVTSSSSSTTAPVNTSSSSTTAPVTTSSSSSTTGTTSTVKPTGITSSTGTSSTSSTTSTSTTATSSTGISFTTKPVSGATPPATTTTPTTTGTGTSTSTSGATTGPISYAIPSNVTDSTVVTFTDPLLESTVKCYLNIPYTSDITVGAIKNFNEPALGISTTNYQLQHPNGPTSSPKPGTSLSDQQSTPVESLNGMQYLQLLPAKTQILFDATLASDPNANTDLTPLDNLNFSSLTLDGDYSDPNAKEIDPSQIAKLNTDNISYIDLSGNNRVSPISGLNNQELAEVAPTLNKLSNNGQSYHMIELGYSSISDFTPLKGSETGKSVLIVAATNTIADATPVYAVDGQPISFTAPKLLDLDGKDLANTYHFTYTVAQSALADDNLQNLGNDNYELTDATPNAKVLTYGNLGWEYSTNPDAYVRETTTNGTTFEGINLVEQPLIWQAHPTVTINYLDQSGKPILANGAPLTKTLAGVNIGDKFDLTADSKVAGYNFKSAPTILSGAYTQNPQVINLVYSKIPAPTPAKKPSTTTPTKTPTTVAPQTRMAVQIYTVSGNPTGENAILADMGVKATTHINGQLFYQVGYGQWVLASDYNPTTAVTAGVVRTFSSDTKLVDSTGKPIQSTLPPNTEWKYSRLVSINGADYYQVATDEFLPVKSSVSFTPVTAKTNINVTTKAVLYDSQGNALTTSLPSGSSWVTDGCAIINGVKMYRIATDEWISSDSSNTYQPVAINYRTPATTTLYDSTGKVLSRTLPAGTSWKVDRVVTINGKQYCRVASNEYIAKP